MRFIRPAQAVGQPPWPSGYSADISLTCLIIRSSHSSVWLGFESHTGHMRDKTSSAYGSASCFFFPGVLPFLPQLLIDRSHIRKTCPCNEYMYPLEPYFYIAKLEYAGVYLFFLFLLQNIDCGFS